ncbi:hypothetical protein HK097_011552 [Rhizophlyctis rosea]|uniref:Uncharacterized protein n=1 Tax=Rhizophlyctis rosea TaxID=64517 RepID=A0AAD5S7Y1_9FUNG|nr:hypothetical protein HK097_011552 [Rhizophlyctis rosea]
MAQETWSVLGTTYISVELDKCDLGGWSIYSHAGSRPSASHLPTCRTKTAILASKGGKNPGQRWATTSTGDPILIDIIKGKDTVALATLASSLLGIVYLTSAPIAHFILRRLRPKRGRKSTTINQQLQELESLVQLNDAKLTSLESTASFDHQQSGRIVTSRAMDIWDSEKESWRRRRGNITAAEERDRMESGGGRKRGIVKCLGRKSTVDRCKTIVQGLLSSKDDDIVKSKCIYFEGPSGMCARFAHVVPPKLLTQIPNSGIGKTTISNHFLTHLRDHNAQISQTTSIPSSHFEAYSTLSDLLINCFPNVPSPEQHPVPSDLADQRRHFFESLCTDDTEVKELLPLLNPLIWTGVPANYFTRAVESQPGCMKQMVKVFLRLVGKAFADRFLVLFVDDYQNCDLMTMQFLNDLITDSTPRHLKILVLVAITAPPSVPALFDQSPTEDLASLPHTTRILLKPLSETDSKELLRATMGRVAEQGSHDSRFDRLVKQTEGVPLLLARAGEALKRSGDGGGDEGGFSKVRSVGSMGGNRVRGIANQQRASPDQGASRESLADRTEVDSIAGKSHRSGNAKKSAENLDSHRSTGDVSECVVDVRGDESDEESEKGGESINAVEPPTTPTPSARQFLTDHINQLFTEELDYLKLCTSLGDTFFEVELLFHVFVRLFPANKMPHLLASLEQLERRGFLTFKKRVTRLGGLIEGYGFDHTSTWSLLRSKVDEEQDRAIQQLIAEWYETQLPPSASGSSLAVAPSPSQSPGGENHAANVTAAAGSHTGAAGTTSGCATVAAHLELGGMHKKAALYYIMAAEGDIRRYCGRTAAECLDRVAEMAKGMDKTVREEAISGTVWTRIEYLLSIAFLQSGKVGQSVGFAEKALKRLEEEEDRLRLGTKARLAKEFFMAALGWRFPRLFLRWDEEETTYQEGALLKNIWLVKVFSELNRTSSLIMTLYTVNVLETYYRATPELLISYGHLVYALGLFRNMRHLQKIYIDRARSVARELTDLYAAVEYQTFIAYSSISQGQFEKGIGQLYAATDVARKLPDHERTYLYPYLFHLTALYYQGRFREALTELEKHIQPYIEKLGGEESHMGHTHRAFLLELNLHLRDGLDQLLVHHYPKIKDLASKFRTSGTGSVLEFRILARAALIASLQNLTDDSRHYLSLIVTHYLPAERGQFMVLYGLAVSSCLETVLRLRAALPNEQGKNLEETYWYLHKVMTGVCELYPFMTAELCLYEAVYAFIHSKEGKAVEALERGLTEARRFGMRFQEGLISAHAREMFPGGEKSVLKDMVLADCEAVAAELGVVWHLMPMKRKFWWGLWGLQKKSMVSPGGL